MSDQVDLKRCAHCGSWIPAAATMCASCGTSDVDGARAAGGAPQRSPRPDVQPLRLPRGWTVTRLIIWMNGLYMIWALYVQFTYTPKSSILRALLSFNGLNQGNFFAGAYDHASVADGQWWRVVTAFFLHGGLIHIAMNMWVLSRIGPFLEEVVGPIRFLVVYLVSGIGSTLAISIWYAYLLGSRPNDIPMMIGASGAIFGVLGALATFALRAGNLRGRALGMTLWRDIGFMLLLGLFVPVISNTGHVGGLLPGVVFGFLMGGRFTDRLRPSGQRAWVVAAAVLGALTSVALAHGVYFSLQHLGGR